MKCSRHVQFGDIWIWVEIDSVSVCQECHQLVTRCLSIRTMLMVSILITLWPNTTCLICSRYFFRFAQVTYRQRSWQMPLQDYYVSAGYTQWSPDLDSRLNFCTYFNLYTVHYVFCVMPYLYVVSMQFVIDLLNYYLIWSDLWFNQDRKVQNQETYSLYNNWNCILYTITEPVHLIPEVTCEWDCKIIYMFIQPEQEAF